MMNTLVDNRAVLEPLIEKFAKACSNDYSASTDRSQQIIDYVTGNTEQFPDMLPSSNRYAYQTLDLFEKFAKKDDSELFFRAAAILLKVAVKPSRNYYIHRDIFKISLGDHISPIGQLRDKNRNVEKAFKTAVYRLKQIQKHAGDEVIQNEIQSKINQCGLGTKNLGNLADVTDMLLLIKLYGQLNEDYIKEALEKLPPVLQALLTRDSIKLDQELKALTKELVLSKLPLKDNPSSLDLEPEFIDSKRNQVISEQFSLEAGSKREPMTRETFYSHLLQVHASFMYLLTWHGGKTAFLSELDEIGELVLAAVRTLHEFLPLEVRSQLLLLEDKNKQDAALLEGIVSQDEPYAIIETLTSELKSYSIPWDILTSSIVKSQEKSERAIEIARSPFIKAFLLKVLTDADAQRDSDGKLLEEFVFSVLRSKVEGSKFGLLLGRYLAGEISLKEFKDSGQYEGMVQLRNRDPKKKMMLLAVTFLRVDSEAYRRLSILVCHNDSDILVLLSQFYHSTFFSGSRILDNYREDHEIDTEKLLLAMLKLNGQPDWEYTSMPNEEYRLVIANHLREALQCYKELPNESRLTVLEIAFEAVVEHKDSEVLTEAIRLGLTDSSKKANTLAQAEFSKIRDTSLYLQLYRAEKKASIKEMVLDAVRTLPDAKSVYSELYSKEKTAGLKSLIGILMETIGQSPAAAHAALAEAADVKKRSRLDWIPLQQLPALMGTDGERLDDNIKLYLLLQSIDYTAGPNERLKEVKNYASAASLSDLVRELTLHWIQKDAPSKEKWVLYLSALFGDDRLVELIAPQVKTWADNSRGAIAAEAVKSLAYMSDSSALMTIDKIKRTIKNRQVKAAAEEALITAAENQGLTQPELEDRLITSLGFDEKGTQRFDYGNRSFVVKVTSDLELSVKSEETGKAIKNLPAPGQNDDEQLAAESKARFSKLKKDLKSMISIQSARLEESLSKQRLWSAPDWEALFVQNVIMRNFAVGLIWGTYEENQLVDTFRYMEDGTFNHVDEEEYELASNARIGLVHPLELDEHVLSDWRQQLEDYEIKQPFEQLNRAVYAVSEELQNERKYADLPGEDFSPTAFPKALEKLGWYKGQAQDAGFYYELYKEYGDLIAELTFSGTSIVYYGEAMEDITLESVSFYTKQKSRYHYYNPNKACKLGEIPARVYSETLHDILKAAGR